MDLAAARALAGELMARHGLSGWTLVLDNAKTRAGVCRAGRRQIGLSRHLTALHPEAEVRDTILHEIAHALAGPEHGHDAVWRATAVRIGCSGTRCLSPDSQRVDAAWSGVCPAGHAHPRHRRPTRVVSCRRCSPRGFSAHAILDWTYRGRRVPMHPRYVAELEAIRSAAGRRPAPPGATRRQGGRHELRPLRAGEQVVLLGTGRYAGLVGTVQGRGRTRWKVMTGAGLLTAPRELLLAMQPEDDDGPQAGMADGTDGDCNEGGQERDLSAPR